jgi:iron(III) transport system substrate-binding protein
MRGSLQLRGGLLLALLLLPSACRVERVTPHGGGAVAIAGEPAGEVWLYTSMYRHVVDGFEALAKERLPEVTLRVFQAGSEKVASRLDAELAAGGTQADLLATSDPFFYERLEREGRLDRYASPNVLRVPRSLVDLDGHYAAFRLSTMVLVHRRGTAAPKSFAELAEPKWRGEVALGDPLTSGTAFTWAVFARRKLGEGYFQKLRENRAVVAGGNAAVLQKVEGGEASVGVLLLENALAAKAKGSPIEVAYPEDGAVLVPGPLALFKGSRNPVAARALYDLMLSPEGQALIVKGDMHAVDPRLPGPAGERGLAELLEHAQPWDEAVVTEGLEQGQALKAEFARVFGQ